MIAELEILGTVVLAAVLGGIIGFDRELADKPAGLRTHMLVAASASLLVSLLPILVERAGLDPSTVQSDPIRVMEAVVVGVTFLGAGTIIRQRAGIEGLTTAASLLFVAALGIAVALSQYLLAAGLTVINLVVLRGLKWIESRYMEDEEEEHGSGSEESDDNADQATGPKKRVDAPVPDQASGRKARD